MSAVSLTNITVLDNPTKITNPFQFDIVFECLVPLQHDLEFKIVYVGSAEDDRFDQTLDCIEVGPVPVGINKFVFQADAPQWSLIPQSEILGATVVLIICSYQQQEFVRVGYYVNNEYENEQLRIDPPEQIQLEGIVRNILSDKPRVTRIPIKWDETVDPEMLPPPPMLEGEEEDLVDGDGDGEGDEEEGEGDEMEEEEEDFFENSSDNDDPMDDGEEGMMAEEVAEEQPNAMPLMTVL